MLERPVPHVSGPVVSLTRNEVCDWLELSTFERKHTSEYNTARISLDSELEDYNSWQVVHLSKPWSCIRPLGICDGWSSGEGTSNHVCFVTVIIKQRNRNLLWIFHLKHIQSIKPYAKKSILRYLLLESRVFGDYMFDSCNKPQDSYCNIKT